MKTHIEILRVSGACDDGLAFASQFPDMASAIAACDNAEWLRWALQLIADKRVRVGVAAHIARNTPTGDGRTTYDLLTDKRSREALDVCDAYAKGEATDEDLMVARYAASAAYCADINRAICADYAALSVSDATHTAYAGYAADAACTAYISSSYIDSYCLYANGENPHANEWQMTYIKSLDWNRIIHAE